MKPCVITYLIIGIIFIDFQISVAVIEQLHAVDVSAHHVQSHQQSSRWSS